MFEQSLIHTHARGPRGWALGGSLLTQLALAAALAIPPLLTTYTLPEEAWRETLLYLAPPPPPAPPPQAKPKPRPPVERFDEVLRQPTKAPETALIEQAPEHMALHAAPAGLPSGVIGGTLDAPPLPPSAVPAVDRPIRVGGSVQAARILEKVTPVYPKEAIEERISGVVTLEAIIDKEGSIRGLVLVDGHPLLAPAAIEAVSQWRYQPTVLNGAPVEVQTSIAVRFNLVTPPPEDDPKQKRRRRGR